MTYNDALRMAIKQLTTLLTSKDLHLTRGQASLCAEMMTQLTNKQWSVKPHDRNDQTYWGPYDTGSPRDPLHDPDASHYAKRNRNIGGSI